MPGRGGAWSQGVSGPGGVDGHCCEMATAAGGTHPTGMHSCLCNFFGPAMNVEDTIGCRSDMIFSKPQTESNMVP